MTIDRNIPNNATHVTDISLSGFGLLANNKEYFISYEDYPAFRNADIKDVTNVKTDICGNLHWPSLDVDISVNALEEPEKYPLKDESVKVM